jgi:hypothetical protein
MGKGELVQSALYAPMELSQLVRCGRVNIVQILCICVCKWKTIPGMGRGGIMENDGGGEFNYDI